MTGFSSLQETFFNKNMESTFLWEIKSVNGRSLDIKTRLPFNYEDVNQLIRLKISSLIKRGNVQVNLQINQTIKEPQIKINYDLLEELKKAALKIKETNSDAFGSISPEGLLAINGVVENLDQEMNEEDKKSFNNALIKAFDSALEKMILSRLNEGAQIQKVLADNLDKMLELKNQAEEIAKNLSSSIMSKLKKQVAELLENSVDISDEKIIQETAFIAIKADIKEEIDRLAAHINSAKALLEETTPIGRKFDFMAQEMHREVNTICSKSNDIELTRIALDLKVIIDQIKEQIQNIE